MAMDNAILDIDITNHSVDPAQAEVWLTVWTAHRDAGTEIRGRLMGPRCPYSSTVEVAYPLRLRPGMPDPAGPFPMRVIIPEASLWDLQSPFLYQGPVELWQDGRRCAQVAISHGLRGSLRLGPAGLAINGKPVVLRGRRFQGGDERALQLFRQQGGNLVLTPVSLDTAELWTEADRLGLLMLGLIGAPEEADHPLLSTLARRPSSLGWMLRPAALPVLPRLLALPGGGKVGLWPEGPHGGDAVPGIQLILADEHHRERLAGSGLPALLAGPEAPAEGAGGLGWVELPAGA
jgi:hypothetical protein